MNKNEIGSYLAKQKVTRKITRLQVHHMDLPNYSTWEKTDKKVFSEPHFGRTQSLNDYGRRTWGSNEVINGMKRFQPIIFNFKIGLFAQSYKRLLFYSSSFFIFSY